LFDGAADTQAQSHCPSESRESSAFEYNIIGFE